MLSNCLKCRKNAESKNPKVARAKTEEQYFYQNVECVIVKRKTKFVKQQQASGLLSSLGIKTPSSKIPLVSPLLF